MRPNSGRIEAGKDVEVQGIKIKLQPTTVKSK